MLRIDLNLGIVIYQYLKNKEGCQSELHYKKGQLTQE